MFRILSDSVFQKSEKKLLKNHAQPWGFAGEYFIRAIFCNIENGRFCCVFNNSALSLQSQSNSRFIYFLKFRRYFSNLFLYSVFSTNEADMKRNPLYEAQLVSFLTNIHSRLLTIAEIELFLPQRLRSLTIARSLQSVSI